MGVGEGVPLNELHCPTCGEQIRDFRLHVEEELFTVDSIMGDIKLGDIKPGGMPRFLRCPQGHKWTVKTLWRCVNCPDRVLLDKFIGV